MTKKKEESKLRPVLITTDKDKRGVFAGLLEDDQGSEVVLQDVRMVVYWSSDVRGVFGLAATGPTARCRISRAAPRARINGVTALVDVSPAAWAKFEEEPWSQ